MSTAITSKNAPEPQPDFKIEPEIDSNYITDSELEEEEELEVDMNGGPVSMNRCIESRESEVDVVNCTPDEEDQLTNSLTQEEYEAMHTEFVTPEVPEYEHDPLKILNTPDLLIDKDEEWTKSSTRRSKRTRKCTVKYDPTPVACKRIKIQ